jgi:glyoxylase-like metal-dependent hydrolase (beta-lactamase superfamily II)
MKMKLNHIHTKRVFISGRNRQVILALFLFLPTLLAPACSFAQKADQSWTPTKSIDFSSKHNILIKNEDGTLTPMDVPYYTTKLIAPGTWQILSSGDFSYLIEGDNEALAIDSTYGAGNIREYMQTLTKKPVRYVANTHDHFDHTANNSYFDRAFMSAFAKDRATIPYASFAGMNFPRNYPITVIGDGYKFQLGNREIEVFEVPNHTMGDLAFLDKREHILFSGDVFLPMGMTINDASTLTRFRDNMRKLAARRSEFTRMAGGFGMVEAASVDNYLANAEYILAGHEGVPVTDEHHGPPPSKPDPSGQVVYIRHFPHPGDGGAGQQGPPNPNLRKMTYANCTIIYDITKIK